MIPGWGTDTYTFPTPFADGTFKIGDVIFAEQQVAVIGMTAALVAVLYVFFRYSKLGVAMQATSQNQLAAAYMGIPVRRVNMMIWGLSAGVAAFAGILLAPVTAELIASAVVDGSPVPEEFSAARFAGVLSR